jgi:hypothetical protein
MTGTCFSDPGNCHHVNPPDAGAGRILVTLSGSFNDAAEIVNVSGPSIGVSPTEPAPVDGLGNTDAVFTIADTAVADSYDISVGNDQALDEFGALAEQAQSPFVRTLALGWPAQVGAKRLPTPASNLQGRSRPASSR